MFSNKNGFLKINLEKIIYIECHFLKQNEDKQAASYLFVLKQMKTVTKFTIFFT